MLPRLANVITQAITTQPTAKTSADSDPHSSGPSQGAPASLKLVPPPEENHAEGHEPERPDPRLSLRTFPQTLGQALQTLLEQLRQGLPIMRRIGIGAYQMTLRISKRSGKIKKGALIDRRAE